MGQLLGNGSGNSLAPLMAALFPPPPAPAGGAPSPGPAAPSPNAAMPAPATGAFGAGQGFNGIAQGFQGLNTLSGGTGDGSDVWDQLASMFGAAK